jgi:uncharacterized protein (TIGR01777 family)
MRAVSPSLGSHLEGGGEGTFWHDRPRHGGGLDTKCDTGGSLRESPEQKAMRIAVTGASGLVGQALVRHLESGGHEMLRLVRRAPRAKGELHWDPDRNEIDGSSLEGVDAVVHLAGESIAERRWTAAKKVRLQTSRIGPTRLLAQTLAGLACKPMVLVSASAVGYYGNRGADWLDETSPPGADFLARLCVDWERATESAARAGIRVVNLRTGLVLSPHGGALAKMLPLFRAGLGGILGPGTQYVSWIAIDDLVGAIGHALANPAVDGPLNAVAPTPVTNLDLTKTLGRVLGRPTVARVPAFALHLAFGELAGATLLASQRVRPQRLLATGYRFGFPELPAALRHVLGTSSGGHAGSPTRA